MDYEKLHKDTITKLQEMVNSGKITAETARGICADFVPESEDEKIRRALMKFIEKIPYERLENDGVSVKDALAWLEKQGEQKLPIEKLSSEMKTVGESLGFTNLEECNKYNQMVTDLIMSDDDNGEQKPAWSEEDEAGLGDALWAIEQARTIAKDENDMGNLWYAERWLNSFRNKVIPQQKQEWSKEDINMIDWLIRCCEKEHEELCNDKYGHQDIVSELKSDCRKKWDWLESLKNRVAPQSQWKPSDEQMYWLKWVAHRLPDTEKANEAEAVLEDLLEQLKKLKG